MHFSKKVKGINKGVVLHHIAIFTFLFLVQTDAQAQNLKTPLSFSGKKYLAETGVYLRFLNEKQAIFNVDTFEYKVQKDTIYLERISWLIGETRRSFTQRYVYLFRLERDSLQLFDPTPSSNEDGNKNMVLLKDISQQKTNLAGLKSATITKSEYITWRGETDTGGNVVRKEIIYVITSLTVTKNRRLLIEIRQQMVVQTPDNTTHQDKVMSKKSRRLSRTEYNSYFNELKAQYYPFLKGENLCGEHSLSYTFLYTTSNGVHTYKRCWLNQLEFPVANWIPGR